MLSHFSRVRLFATPWTVACQAPLSMDFSRQEYCSGLPFPTPGDLPKAGIEPVPLTPSVGRFFTTSTAWEAEVASVGLLVKSLREDLMSDLRLGTQ